ncbi:MAG: hypothetical protein FJ295_00290 [Planctomycetes bacterium]|nr:hypothetical protein [Planctomycetota bacterium]
MAIQCSYDITRSWEENCQRGPQFLEPAGPVPDGPWKTFLGMPVRSRLGIAAGLLANSRWVLPYAKRGFDILTYKTVRSEARECYPLPNWVFVDGEGNPDDPAGPVTVTDRIGDDPTRISSSVCFGMPSVAPGIWRDDVRQARSGLAPGQLLIVSVVATPGPRDGLDELADDFARCAAWAVASGSHAIEANLSCPNVCSAEGTLYHDAEASRLVAQRIRAAIGSVPLLLKLGAFPSDDAMVRLFRAVNGLADGVTMVNCLSRPVLHPNGEPVFGARFRMAGVLGRSIHRPSVEIVRAAKNCLEREKLSLQIAAVGGASTIEDIADFFHAGADAVLCGSSPMYLPDLAIEAKRRHPEW